MPDQPSRREFLSTLAGTGATLLLAPHLRAAEPDPRIAQIIARTIAVDMHSHIPIPWVKTPADAKPDPAFDLPVEMKAAGFSAVCQTFNIDAVPNPTPGDDYKYFLQALDFEDRLLARNHMRRALNMHDLQAAHDQHQPIIIQATEGAQFIAGDLGRVEESYRRGLRLLQLVHERDDLAKPLGDVYTGTPHLGGLTPFGVQVIKECNRLGIVIDLEHGSHETVAAALKASTHPIIVSHTALASDALYKNATPDMRRRMLSRDHARLIANAGGLIGVWWRLTASVKDYVTALRAMSDAVGPDHVGIGTDTELTSPAGPSGGQSHTNKIWPDQTAGFVYAVTAEMLHQNFTPADISKIIGANFIRIFAQVTHSQKLSS